MYQTISNLQNGKATSLQSVVDNTDGKLYVALREISYEVDYYNVGSSAEILCSTYSIDGVSRKTITVPRGLYTFKQLSTFIMGKIPGLTLDLNKETGLVTLFFLLNYEKDTVNIIFSHDLLQILGFDADVWFGERKNQSHRGYRPVKFIPHKWFYIYLDQLSTSSNYVDGAGSTLLAIVPASVGGTINIPPPYPMYKELERGYIHQLNLRVLDEEGAIVDNHQIPITLVLEIRENT